MGLQEMKLNFLGTAYVDLCECLLSLAKRSIPNNLKMFDAIQENEELTNERQICLLSRKKKKVNWKAWYATCENQERVTVCVKQMKQKTHGLICHILFRMLHSHSSREGLPHAQSQKT